MHTVYITFYINNCIFGSNSIILSTAIDVAERGNVKIISCYSSQISTLNKSLIYNTQHMHTFTRMRGDVQTRLMSVEI